MSNNMNLIDAIMNGDAQAARLEFDAAINDKVSTVLDIRRVAMASAVFNQVKEGVEINEFQDTASKRKSLSPQQKIKEIEAEIKQHEDTIKRRSADGNPNHLDWRKDEVVALKKQLENLKKNEILNPDVIKHLPEEEELDEAVRVSTERYVRSHSKQPKGRGGWFFSSSSKGDDKGQEFSFNGSYADAKQKAREWAKSKNIDYIYVMEGVEGEEETLEEATKPGSKIIITHGTHKGETARIGEINLGLHKDDKSYVVDLKDGSNVTLKRGSFKLVLNKPVNEDCEDDMEEAVLSREQERAKNSDFDRVMAGAMKRDDYNKKWKLGQYKTNAGSPYIAKMLSSPVKKEGVEAEEEMEEAQTPGQKFDFQKVLHGAMSQDEYNKKYKLGKYRPAGSKLAGPGGLYKNLVKKP